MTLVTWSNFSVTNFEYDMNRIDSIFPLLNELREYGYITTISKPKVIGMLELLPLQIRLIPVYNQDLPPIGIRVYDGGDVTANPTYYKHLINLKDYDTIYFQFYLMLDESEFLEQMKGQYSYMIDRYIDRGGEDLFGFLLKQSEHTALIAHAGPINFKTRIIPESKAFDRMRDYHVEFIHLLFSRIIHGCMFKTKPTYTTRYSMLTGNKDEMFS